jgi:hypothetical protein
LESWKCQGLINPVEPPLVLERFAKDRFCLTIASQLVKDAAEIFHCQQRFRIFFPKYMPLCLQSLNQDPFRLLAGIDGLAWRPRLGGTGISYALFGDRCDGQLEIQGAPISANSAAGLGKIRSIAKWANISIVDP